jgi:hypothetical protein
MKALLAFWLAAVAVFVWLEITRHSSFEQRWTPAIEHPLKAVSAARSSFCHPIKCIVG